MSRAECLTICTIERIWFHYGDGVETSPAHGFNAWFYCQSCKEMNGWKFTTGSVTEEEQWNGGKKLVGAAISFPDEWSSTYVEIDY